MNYIEAIVRNFHFRELQNIQTSISQGMVDARTLLWRGLHNAYSQGSRRLTASNWVRIAVGSAAILLIARSFFRQYNRNVVLAAVKQDGYALQYASPELQKDPEVVAYAIIQFIEGVQNTKSEIRDNLDVILTEVRKFGLMARSILPAMAADPNSKELLGRAIEMYQEIILVNFPALKNNRDVFLAALRKDGYAFLLASDDFRKDREVVLVAAKQFGVIALTHADPKFQDDREVVLAAMKQNSRALKLASPALKDILSKEIDAIKLLRCGLLTGEASSLGRVQANRRFDGNVLNIVQQFLIGDQVIQFGIGLKSKIAFSRLPEGNET